MSNEIVRADYAELDELAARFARSADATGALQKRVRQAFLPLAQGSWKGRGEAAFTAEMERKIFPSVQRLETALEQARTVTLQIEEVIAAAEREAAALFGASGGGGEAATGADTADGPAASVTDHIADFFRGMWDEGSDMVHGLVNMVAHPIDTARGLWQALQNPGQLWEAFKQPYVEAWESGHPMRAVGRGVLFVGSMLLGTKGADKAAKAAKVAKAADTAAAAAEAGARFGRAADAAGALGATAKGSRAEAGIARFVAQESTHQVGAVDRVVLGQYFEPGKFKLRPDGSIYRGYIDEATAKGGKYFSTDKPVWDAMKGSDRTWNVNREFLQGQMERGVSRIELTGETAGELFSRRADSFTAMEVDFLRSKAYEYGYRQVGDTWEKVGPWRASTGGRVAGGSIGPGLDVVQDAQSLNPGSTR